MGAVHQNWLIPQKFHKKQSCRVSKSKIIMCLWSVALKARKAAKVAANILHGLDCIKPKVLLYVLYWKFILASSSPGNQIDVIAT